MPQKLSILHISDLHRDPANPISNHVLLDSLERDRDRYTAEEGPAIAPPNFIIVSGDIVQGVKHGADDAAGELRAQYDQALSFLNDLTDRFVDGDKQRVVVVPGNHDVCDNTFRQSLTRVEMEGGARKALVAELFRPDSPMRWCWDELALFKVANEAVYNQRFAAFSEFYGTFYDGARSYSIDPAAQVDVFDQPDLGISIVGFCSCHNNDLLNRQGAIHPDCIAGAGKKLREISKTYEPLRIAVWHHNTAGPPAHMDYMDSDIVQNMIDSGFSLGFHGHQHKPEILDTRFRHGVNRRIAVVCAGTLCGGPALRFGRAYNVVEVDVENRIGRLHLREMKNDNLKMPIWGPSAIASSQASYIDFDFDAPPEPFVKPDRETVLLKRAQGFYESGDYRAAEEIVAPLSADEPLARRLLLECLLRLDDSAAIVRAFDPPEGAAESIALMDALWATNSRGRLAEILRADAIAKSTDPSVIEMREKYSKRLEA